MCHQPEVGGDAQRAAGTVVGVGRGDPQQYDEDCDSAQAQARGHHTVEKAVAGRDRRMTDEREGMRGR
ncbi:hypothetical protein [Streptomyces barkulensis]|uniref:hypothetical protein n=1 Tax=Streptomyces barkulensis TaxID=1257026 RepID=UPI001403B213|nr:hypothetical protein [Streptomyces barkulensis]